MQKITLLLFLSLISCNTKKYSSIDLSKDIIVEKKLPLDSELNYWLHLDITEDTIPGISLDKSYQTILESKKGKEVIVAVLDMEIDIEHEDLKDNIWLNKDEIPDNGKDDDENGYIDDIHGWNFLGNTIDKNNRFVLYEYTRILNKGKDWKQEGVDSFAWIEKYKRAKKKFEERMEYAKKDTAYINMVSNSKKQAKDMLLNYFGLPFEVKKLDSLKEVYPKDSLLQSALLRMRNFIVYEFTDEYIEDYRFKANEYFNKLLNIDYNDREIQGDDPDNLTDTDYGNNKVNANVDFFEHGTLMAGVIAAKRDNDIGIKGISDNIKIMSLPISAFGDEHDKDIALAIRYAVNNGAKVINMSFGKEFSLYPKWVWEAFQYAEENNVLIVSSAGNSGNNLDKPQHKMYPNDYTDEKEITDNFLSVGGSTHLLNENLLYKYSNYGAKNVDLFAPGKKVYTTSSKKKKYRFSTGTSIASALTSGVAALLYSYYPNLTASEVKHILMDSGLEYTFLVSTPTEEDPEKKTPFNKLSKSGKVLNAYNALIMADSISKGN